MFVAHTFISFAQKTNTNIIMLMPKKNATVRFRVFMNNICTYMYKSATIGIIDIMLGLELP